MKIDLEKEDFLCAKCRLIDHNHIGLNTPYCFVHKKQLNTGPNGTIKAVECFYFNLVNKFFAKLNKIDIFTCKNFDPIKGACGKCNTETTSCQVGNEIESEE